MSAVLRLGKLRAKRDRTSLGDFFSSTLRTQRDSTDTEVGPSLRNQRTILGSAACCFDYDLLLEMPCHTASLQGPQIIMDRRMPMSPRPHHIGGPSVKSPHASEPPPASAIPTHIPWVPAYASTGLLIIMCKLLTGRYFRITAGPPAISRRLGVD